MNSFINRKKRVPLGETDAGNRKAGATPTAKGGRNDARKPRAGPPPFKSPGPAPRGAPRSGTPTGAGRGARSNSRQRPRSAGPKNAADARVGPNNDATRARMYKAEAYEAKVRVAAQERRIEALRNELEEVRVFRGVENNIGGRETDSNTSKSKVDAALIEALAQELKTMEKDLAGSRARVAELEKDAKGESKSEKDVSEAHSVDKDVWDSREAELKKQLERQRKELANSQRDVAQGVEIIRGLESNLKAARAERDDWMEGKELEVSLKSAQNERDEAIAQLSSSREEVDALEARNEDLQNVLQTVKTQMEEIKHAALEYQSRENKLKLDHQAQYDKKVEESREMESAFASQFEAQQEKLLSKAAAVKELEGSVASLKQQLSVEMGELKRTHERVVSSLETRHAQELKEKNDQYESRESYWRDITKEFREELTDAQQKYEEFEAVERTYISEIKVLKDSMNIDIEGPHDELQSENSMLKAENADLSHKLQKGLEIHTKMKAELEAKTQELNNAQEEKKLMDTLKKDYSSENTMLKLDNDDLSRKLQKGLEIHTKTKAELEAKTQELNNAQEEKKFMDTLKKDYSLAVTLSIERGKKIQSLQKDAAMHNAQASKLVQRIKNLEKKSESSLAIGAEVADKRWEAEVSSLRSKLCESEAKISALEQASSRNERLESDLANARKENDASHLKIHNLQEAMRDMEAALKALSSRIFSPRKVPNPIGHEEKRRHIENGALEE